MFWGAAGCHCCCMCAAVSVCRHLLPSKPACNGPQLPKSRTRLLILTPVPVSGLRTQAGGHGKANGYLEYKNLRSLILFSYFLLPSKGWNPITTVYTKKIITQSSGMGTKCFHIKRRYDFTNKDLDMKNIYNISKHMSRLLLMNTELSHHHTHMNNYLPPFKCELSRSVNWDHYYTTIGLG